MSTFPAAHAPLPTRSRRILVTAVVAGAAVVAALWAASAWVPLLGHAAVVAAVAAGAVAVWAALTEYAAYRREASEEQARTLQDHRAHIRAVHEGQREVLAAIDVRTRALRTTLAGSRAQLGEAKRSASRLRGDQAALKADNDALRLSNAGLRELLAAVEPAAQGEDADVFALPRRRTTGAELDALEAPTVVDLDLQRLASPFVEDVLRRHAN